MLEAVMNATLDKKILRNSSRIKEKQTSRGSGTLRRPYVRFGYQQTSRLVPVMSVIPLKAAIRQRGLRVR
jgi:hypothetical protein